MIAFGRSSYRRLLTALLVVAQGGCDAVEDGPKVAGKADGTIESTCAPYDGPAFLIRIVSAERSQVLSLNGFDRLDKAVGRWVVEPGSKPGGAGGSLCAVGGTCELAKSGTFKVASKAGALEVEYDLVLWNGQREVGKARVAPVPQGSPNVPRLVCG